MTKIIDFVADFGGILILPVFAVGALVGWAVAF